jgi:hypothetical protein
MLWSQLATRCIMMTMVGAALLLSGATTNPASAQPPLGDCAGCTDCWTCKSGLQYGVENCDQSGGGSCPCRNQGDACNPGFALGLTGGTEFLVLHTSAAGGIQKYLLRLEDRTFGEFDCRTGDLIGAYTADDGVLAPVNTQELETHRSRYHLSNYLDTTRLLTGHSETRDLSGNSVAEALGVLHRETASSLANPLSAAYIR